MKKVTFKKWFYDNCVEDKKCIAPNKLCQLMQDKILELITSYEEQLSILSEQIPKGAVDMDKHLSEIKAICQFKVDIEKAFNNYKNNL